MMARMMKSEFMGLVLFSSIREHLHWRAGSCQ
jgi:hypothetical protein